MSERLVSPFLERSDNSKGKLAYKTFFDMSEEKEFVTNEQGSKVTSFNPSNHHFGELHKLIDDFFRFTMVCDYQAASNETLSAFLDKSLCETDFKPDHIKDVVYMSCNQSQFLSSLKERWALIKSFSNPQN